MIERNTWEINEEEVGIFECRKRGCASIPRNFVGGLSANRLDWKLPIQWAREASAWSSESFSHFSQKNWLAQGAIRAQRRVCVNTGASPWLAAESRMQWRAMQRARARNSSEATNGEMWAVFFKCLFLSQVKPESGVVSLWIQLQEREARKPMSCTGVHYQQHPVPAELQLRQPGLPDREESGKDGEARA